MQENENNRHTGARKFPADTGPDPQDDFAQDAAANKPPRGAFGISAPADDVEEKTRHSEGMNPPSPGPAQTVGAGAALGARSKDAQPAGTDTRQMEQARESLEGQAEEEAELPQRGSA